MQLVRNGPDVPERLLQAHEEGRVVFFCGAGISYPAGLPGFDGLVRELYDGVGVVPSAVQSAAIRQGQYDTAISLLEGSVVGGRTEVRKQLPSILNPNLSLPRATATHEALLTLARTRLGSCRLITTNFDRVFEQVRSSSSPPIQTFEAPLLPIPKNRWDGLVYLHGLLPTTPTDIDLNRLVLSSGDFGLAYLTERWAARFVSELFRTYVVCFIGYSINDPVLRYMMDALAADRLLGESPPETFAFASFSRNAEDKAIDEWEAKHVTPVLYQNFRRHHYLHRTLQTWSEIYRDGVLGKERIVAQYAISRPLASTRQDDFVGRVLWALSDDSGLPAKRFAEADPVPSLDWLEPLTETRFGHADLSRFGVAPHHKQDAGLAFSILERPSPYQLSHWMSPVQSMVQHDRWDNVMGRLAFWLSRHIDDPNLILWVAEKGGRLHPNFQDFISNALEKGAASQSVEILWELILSDRIKTYGGQLDLYSWRRKHARQGLTPTLRMQLRELLSPQVRLSKPFKFSELDDDIQPEHSATGQRIQDIVSWDIVLAADHVHVAFRDASDDGRWREALPKILTDLTDLLRETLDLMQALGGATNQADGTYVHHPSIAPHPQNRNFRDWTSLIELVRDAFLASSDTSIDQAQSEVRRWVTIPYPIFRRLTFFAATETNLFAPEEALNWLLADDHWWLWSVETQREAIRLLMVLGNKLTEIDRQRLLDAILQGPPREMFREDLEFDQYQRISDREIWLRLAKLRAAGIVLVEETRETLERLSLAYPDWQLAEDQSDEFPFWMGDGFSLQKFTASPRRRRDLEAWLASSPAKGEWDEDDWRDRCQNDFPRALIALLHLARGGKLDRGAMARCAAGMVR
jgi:hypothetical protein